MTAQFQDVRPGQPVILRAPDINGWNAAARAEQRRSGGGVSSTRPELFAGGVPNVKVRNDSGEEVPLFGILTLGSVLFTVDDNEQEFASQPVFRGAKPTDNLDNIPIICYEPISPGKIGMGFIPGHAIPVMVDVEEEYHWFANLKEDSVEVLASHMEHGYPILWKEGGTGEKWAKILLVRKPEDHPMLHGPLVDDPDDGWTVEEEPVWVPYDPILSETWAVEGFVVRAYWDGEQYVAVPPPTIIAQLETALALDDVATCQTYHVTTAGSYAAGDGDVNLQVFDFLQWGPLPVGTRITAQLDTAGMRYVVNGASCTEE